jgi:flagellar basal-body rod protein FlgF
MDNAQLVAHSRLQTLQRQLDVLANNIANSATTGFKSRDMQFGEYLMPRAKSDLYRVDARTISFVMDRGATLDFTDGAVEYTGNATDIALRGQTLLAVKTPTGERYTRNGALGVNAKGEIVTSDGYAVMGSGGPIIADPSDGKLEITPDGMIGNRSGPLDRLKIVDVPDPSKLSNIGGNLFSTSAPLAASKTPEIAVGSIEKSNVQPVLAMSRLLEVTRAYTALTTSMQRLDDTQKNALERLATVPA